MNHFVKIVVSIFAATLFLSVSMPVKAQILVRFELNSSGDFVCSDNGQNYYVFEYPGLNADEIRILYNKALNRMLTTPEWFSFEASNKKCYFFNALSADGVLSGTGPLDLTGVVMRSSDKKWDVFSMNTMGESMDINHKSTIQFKDGEARINAPVLEIRNFKKLLNKDKNSPRLTPLEYVNTAALGKGREHKSDVMSLCATTGLNSLVSLTYELAHQDDGVEINSVEDKFFELCPIGTQNINQPKHYVFVKADGFTKDQITEAMQKVFDENSKEEGQLCFGGEFRTSKGDMDLVMFKMAPYHYDGEVDFVRSNFYKVEDGGIIMYPTKVDLTVAQLKTRMKGRQDKSLNNYLHSNNFFIDGEPNPEKQDEREELEKIFNRGIVEFVDMTIKSLKTK